VNEAMRLVDEKRATMAKVVAQSRPALYFSQHFSSNRNKLIWQGEKRETLTQNLKRNNVAQQVEGFCISYFAAFKLYSRLHTV